jgi:hypothetical protein
LLLLRLFCYKAIKGKSIRGSGLFCTPPDFSGIPLRTGPPLGKRAVADAVPEYVCGNTVYDGDDDHFIDQEFMEPYENIVI